MVNVCVGLWGAQELVGGDFASVIDMVRLADEKGIDQVDTPDHVLMCKPEQYVYGKFAVPVDYPWYDPMVALGAIAAATKRVRLTNGIMVAALRPAPVLAKQITTVDVISRGRIDVGIGAGWMPEEFAACGIAWPNRFEYLFELVRAMRALWEGSPATFHGERIHFDAVWQHPLPVQKRIPVNYGLGVPSARNFAGIAETGDGWYPMEENPEFLGPQIVQLKHAFEARGRDPAAINIRVMNRPFYKSDGSMDLDDALRKAPALIAAGVTTICYPARVYCKTIEDFEPFLDRILRVKG